MGNSIRSLGQCLILTLGLFGLAGQVQGGTPSAEVEKGLNWLRSQVGPDGAIASEAGSLGSPLQVRAESLLTLTMGGTPSGTLLDAIAADTEPNNEFAARRAIGLKVGGRDASAPLSVLVARQNGDGGFGTGPGYESDPLDTAWALLAFKTTGYAGTSVIASAVKYLSKAASSDGGYPATSTGVSDIYSTALALTALQAYSQSYSLAAPIDSSRRWLIGSQNGGVYPNLLLNASAVIALVNVTADSGSYGAAVRALVDAQRADGSWDGDPYVTALALRALLSASQGATIPTTGEIIGRVVDGASSAPMGQAQLEILEVPGVAALSSIDGAFTLEGVPAGTYTVRASKVGYGAATISNVAVTPGNVANLGDVVLSPVSNAVSLQGRITDGSTGMPLFGVEVAVTVDGTVHRATSGTTGDYRLSGIAAGTATLVASMNGYDSATGTGLLASGTVYTFSPALYPSGQTPATVSLKGMVVDATSGAAVGGARISVRQSSVMTDASGRFDLTGLAEGPFNATVEANGYTGVTLAGMLVRGVNDAGVLRLSKAAGSTSISGRVFDSVSQLPIAGATLSVLGTTLKGVTGADGRYQIVGITSMQFTVEVAAVGYVTRSTSTTLSAHGTYSVDVGLEKASSSGISIKAVTTNASSYDPDGMVGGSATVANGEAQEASITLRIVVLDSSGKVVKEIQARPGLGAVNPPDLPIAIPATGEKDVLFEWHLLGAAAGSYTLVARASDLSGRVVAEGSTVINIEARAKLGGGIALDPPITQVGAEPVRITATVTNSGNLPINAGQVKLDVTLQNPDTSGETAQVSVTTFLEGTPLSTPVGAVFDAAGNLYVANTNQRKILKITPDGQASVFATISTTLMPQAPQGVVLDSEGNLLVLSIHDRYIRIAPDGTQTAVMTGLSPQYGIDTDSAGNIFITGRDSSGPVLLRIDRTGTKTVLVRSGLASPIGAAFDASGTLYVANYDDNTIVKVSSEGKISPFVSGLNRPQGVTLGPDGNLYVANSGSNNIVRVTPQGIKTVFASGLSTPHELRFNAAGDLLVTNSGNDTVARVNSAGTVTMFARAAAYGPQGLAYDADGNLHIANGGNHTVHKMDAGGAITPFSTTVVEPKGIAISATGDTYVASGGNGSIVRVSGSAPGTFVNGLNYPYGLSFGDEGTLYVSEHNLNQITAVSPGGQKQAVAQSIVDFPRDVLVDANGVRYILNGSFIAEQQGSGVGRVLATGFPSALSFTFAPGGGFYLLERNTLKKLDTNGQVIWNRSAPFSVGGIAADEAGNIYVPDYYNRAIARIDVTGASSTVATFAYYPTDLIGDGAGGLFVLTNDEWISRISPSGVVSSLAKVSGATRLAVDSAGNLYVTAPNSIKVLDAAGKLLRTLSGPSQPTGIAVSAAGELVVLDAADNQLNVYAQDGVRIDFSNGFRNPKGLAWSDGTLFFADNWGHIYSLVPGESPRLVSKMAVDYLVASGGEVYFATSTQLWKLDTASNQTTAIANIDGVSGIASRSGGGFAVAVKNDSRVLILDSNGRTTSTYAGLRTPQGLAIDANDNVFVSNVGIPNIVKIAPNGIQADVFARNISARGLIFDGAGQLYVTANSRVYKASYTGGLTTIAEGMSPAGIAMHDGQLFVTEPSTQTVRRVRGATLEAFASGIVAGRGVQVGADGAVYVVDEASSSLVRYVDGALGMYASGFRSPRALTMDNHGVLYVGGEQGSLAMVDREGVRTDLDASAIIGNTNIGGLTLDSVHALYFVGKYSNRIFKIKTPDPAAKPEAGTIVYSAVRDTPLLAPDATPLRVDFGRWSPEYGGDYLVTIAPADPEVQGLLASGIHVGPHASGVMSSDKGLLTPGDNVVQVTVHVTGADFTTLSKVDTANLSASVTTHGIYPVAMPADRAGNIYLRSGDVIKRISPSNQMTDFATVPGLGSAMAIDSKENLYVTANKGSSRLLRIGMDGSSSELATFPAAPLSIVIDSSDNVIALVGTGLHRVGQDGSNEVINAPLAIKSPYSMTIDGRDNIYIQNFSHLITKLSPDGGVSVVVSPDQTNEPTFEYEGINIAGDCSDNVFLTPVAWKRVGQLGEEHVLVQVIGKTGQVAGILDGFSVKPPITDMDFVSYDRFSSRLRLWTDAGYWVYTMPVTCGAIGVDLHVVVAGEQSASGFNLAPSTTLTRADGSLEYVWSLKDVTAFGQDIQFDAALNDVVLGEHRAVVSEAFLVFKNSFVTGEVKVPLTIPELPVESPVGLVVTTDQPEYTAGTEADIVVDLVNRNAVALSGVLHVDVLDARGALVRTVWAEEVLLPADGPLSVVVLPRFNTEELLAGGYTAKATVKDASGILLVEGSVSFRIVAGTPGSARLAATVSTDKSAYEPYEPVTILARITNLTSNLVFEGLTVSETVTDAGGKVVFREERNIAQLPGGAVQELTFVRDQANAPSGSYVVQQKVVDAAGSLLDTKTIDFTVKSTAQTGAGLKGRLTATPKEVPIGDALGLSATVENHGNADLLAHPITLSVIEPASQKVVASWPYTADLTMGNRFAAAVSWTASGAPNTSYVAVLTATVGGQEVALAQDTFKVTEMPVKLTVTQQFRKEARVLVLAGCGSEANDAQGLANCTAARASAIDTLLTEMTYPHRVTTDVETFQQAFRSGEYNVYWISAKTSKLKDSLAQEIREAVFRGDGYLDDADHDERNKLLDEVPGIRYLGKLGATNLSVSFAAGAFEAGVLPSVGRALKLELAGGHQEATVPGGTTGTLPGVVTRVYGRGHGLLFGIDLIASLKGNPRWREVLARAIEFATPEAMTTGEITAGAYVPLRTTVTNEARSADVVVTVTLPVGATLMRSEPPLNESSDTGASWQFLLAAGESRRLDMAFLAPESAGNFEVSTGVGVIKDGVFKPYGQPVVQGLQVVSATAALADVVGALQGLPLSDSKERKLRDDAVAAAQAARTQLLAGQYTLSIESLVKAVDLLRGISSAEIAGLRRVLDDALRELEWRWFVATTTQSVRKRTPGLRATG